MGFVAMRRKMLTGTFIAHDQNFDINFGRAALPRLTENTLRLRYKDQLVNPV
jgi:hypothetical protein